MRVKAFEQKTTNAETKEMDFEDGESWIATHTNGLFCSQIILLIKGFRN